jgi:hypothetical protein
MAGFFDTLFGGGAQEDAAAKNAIALNQYGTTANNALTSTYNTGVGNLNSAIGAYQPLAALGAQYAPASSMYLNSLGLNGPQGNAAATAAFQNNPGYTGAVNAGTDAIQRQLGAMGMSQSGNAAEDIGTFVQNLQNQQYGNWQTNLGSAGQTGANILGTAAAGQSGGYTNLANLASNYGQNQANVASGIATGTLSDNDMVAAGQAAGAKNLLGAGLSLATLGMGGNPFGGAMTGGGSSLLGSLGSSIGSGIKSLNLGQGMFGGGTPAGI